VPKARLVATLDEAGISFVADPSNEDRRFERVRVRKRADALAALGLTPEAIALSARRLRRAREALDHAAREFLAVNGEISVAGYALINKEALAAAPEDVALRALSHLIGAVGGCEMPLQLAKLETLLAALLENPGKTRTLGRCRLGSSSGRLGVFREVRGEGLPVSRLQPGERALWDNRFRIELGTGEAPILVKPLGEAGWRRLRETSPLAASLPRLAGRTLPSCWRGDVLLGLPNFGRIGAAEYQGLDCRARFISGERRAP
jgi:tRNA(Ile)-lysidine synthase